MVWLFTGEALLAQVFWEREGGTHTRQLNTSVQGGATRHGRGWGWGRGDSDSPSQLLRRNLEGKTIPLSPTLNTA